MDDPQPGPAFDPFEQALAASWPVAGWCDLSIVVAVSGGADSVALVRALHALKTTGRGRMVLAHYNHRWRGKESDADEAFVARLADELDLPIECGRGSGEVTEKGGEGPESTARQSRYAFLKQAARRSGARYVVTAHTADDQAETILHRILRGTGVAGLGGMPRTRRLGEWATLIRPLLPVRRAEVIDYLRRIGQTWREDSSNLELRFARNRIRHELLPLLAQNYNASVVEALLRLGSIAAEAQQVVGQLAEELYERSVVPRSDGSLRIDGSLLADQPRHLVREVCVLAWRNQDWPRQQMGLAEWNELAAAFLAPASELPFRKVFPGSIRLDRDDRFCILGPTNIAGRH